MCIPAGGASPNLTTWSDTTPTGGGAAAPAGGGIGGLLGALSSGLQVAGVLSGARGAASSAAASQQAYEYQAAVNRNNAQVAQWQAQDAIQRGAQAEQQQRLKVAQLKGTQRASLAARGVSLAEGSALNILQDTDYMNELDSLTIRDNAAREAWGHRVQASNYSNDAALLSNRAASSQSASSAGLSSLLAGAGQVASSWYARSATTSRG